jgi:hypothetical protein
VCVGPDAHHLVLSLLTHSPFLTLGSTLDRQCGTAPSIRPALLKGTARPVEDHTTKRVETAPLDPGGDDGSGSPGENRPLGLPEGFLTWRTKPESGS